MRYYQYITEEHARTEVAGEMTAYYEVDDDNRIVRSLELYPDRVAYSYDLDHSADDFGILPDAEMDVSAASQFGRISEVAEAEFGRVWRDTKVSNR
jgi:hypothetical protein